MIKYADLLPRSYVNQHLHIWKERAHFKQCSAATAKICSAWFIVQILLLSFLSNGAKKTIQSMPQLGYAALHQLSVLRVICSWKRKVTSFFCMSILPRFNYSLSRLSRVCLLPWLAAQLALESDTRKTKTRQEQTLKKKSTTLSRGLRRILSSEGLCGRHLANTSRHSHCVVYDCLLPVKNPNQFAVQY